MKRILVLNYEFPPLGGGAGNATYYLLKEFAIQNDISIDLVTSSTGEYKEEKFSENINIYYLDIGKKENFQYQTIKDLLMYSWKSHWFSRKLVKSKSYGLVHAFFGIPCGFIAMELGLPYIVSLRGSDVPFYNKRFYWLDILIFKRLSQIIWSRAKAVIAVSRDLSTLAHITNRHQEISVIYNGINTEEFHPVNYKKNNKHTTILFVGRMIERKGVIFLLEAFSKIVEKGHSAKLVLAGSGPRLESYKERINSHNLSEHVIFLGNVEHEQLPRIYQDADIFVIPSLNEAMGNVTLEALASGLPIITTDTGCAELLKNKEFVIPKASAKAIEEKLLILIEDSDLQDKISLENRELSREMTWEKCARLYKKIYEKI